MHSRHASSRSRHIAITTACALCLCVVISMVIFALLFVNPQITLNGQPYTAATLSSLTDIAMLDDSLTHGNLLAVDGSVIEEGGGIQYCFTVNGQAVEDGSRRVASGDVVTISDGTDVYEEYDEVYDQIPAGVTIQGQGSIHRFNRIGSSGQGYIRTGKISGKVSEIPTVEPQDDVLEYFNVDTGGDKVIALTFDDGPWPEYTEQILDILDEYGAKATFFTVGTQVEKYTDLVAREYDEGHEVCTHTYSHAAGSGGSIDLGRMSEEEEREEFSRGLSVIEEATGGEAPRVARVPGGNLSVETAEIMRDYVDVEVGWNIDSRDWSRPGVESITQQLLSAQSGNIVLMHDGGGDRSQTVEALRSVLPQLIAQGYAFVTIDELLQRYAS